MVRNSSCDRTRPSVRAGYTVGRDGRLSAEMTNATVRSADGALVLAGPLTAEVVSDTRTRMLAQLHRGSTCEIRTAEVTQLDAAGAQLLYAFVVEAQRRGGAWTSASVYLVEAACMLGMERCLGLARLLPEVTSWQP